MILYDELSRMELKHGYKIVGKFTDETTGTHRRMKFFVDSPTPTEQEVDDRIDEMKEDIEFSYNPLNRYHMSGGNVKPKVIYTAQFVRGTPECTRPALVSVINTEFPAMIWKAHGLLKDMEEYLEEHLDITQTFDEFKQYLIDNKFRGLD